MNIRPDFNALLIRLGWTAGCVINITNNHTYHRSETESSIYVRGVRTQGSRYRVHETTFLLGCDDRDAHDEDRIPDQKIDVSRVGWEKRVFLWHTKVTLKLAEIRAKHAPRDHLLKTRLQTREDHVLALRAITGNTAYLSISGHTETNAVKTVLISPTVSQQINLRLEKLPTAEEAAHRGMQLIELLKLHGFIGA